jgi:hypothetical protein
MKPIRCKVKMMTLERLKELPGVTAAIAAAPQCGRPEEGITIWGTDRVAITCQFSNIDDIKKMTFHGWNREEFHYCPSGKWSDWVALATRILEVNSKL